MGHRFFKGQGTGKVGNIEVLWKSLRQEHKGG